MASAGGNPPVLPAVLHLRRSDADFTAALRERFRVLDFFASGQPFPAFLAAAAAAPEPPCAAVVVKFIIQFQSATEVGPIDSVMSRIKVMYFREFRGEKGEIAFLKLFYKSAKVLEAAVVMMANPSFTPFREDVAFSKAWQASKVNRCEIILVLEGTGPEGGKAWSFKNESYFPSGELFPMKIISLARAVEGFKDVLNYDHVWYLQSASFASRPSNLWPGIWWNQTCHELVFLLAVCSAISVHNMVLPCIAVVTYLSSIFELHQE